MNVNFFQIMFLFYNIELSLDRNQVIPKHYTGVVKLCNALLPVGNHVGLIFYHPIF